MRFERITVVADEFGTTDRPFALARRLAMAADVPVHVVSAVVGHTERDEMPGWRLKRRLDAHGLSAAHLRVLRADDPGAAIAELLDGDDGSLVLRATSAGGHDGGPLLDRIAETIMTRVGRPLLLLGPRQTNPRRDARLSPITVRDGASDAASLALAVEIWTSTFPDVAPEILDVLPPDQWSRPRRDLSSDGETGTVPGVTELRTGDLDQALTSYLDRRHDAVLVVSSPRSAFESSHWWATARQLVLHQTCPVLIVPAVGLTNAGPARGGRRTYGASSQDLLTR